MQDITAPQADFKTSFMKTIPYIDPDSPRHIDWIFALRMQQGNDTYVATHDFPNEKGRVSMQDTVDVVDRVDRDEWTKHVYYSDCIYRAYYVEMGKLMLTVVLGNKMDGNCSMVALGDEDVVRAIQKDFEETFKVPNSIDLTVLSGFARDGSPMTNTHTIKEDGEQIYLARDSFYPFIEEGIDELVAGFKASRSSVMVLLGPPGTGKSTLLRTIMFKMQMENNVTINDENALENPALMPFVHQMPPGTLMMIEDADSLCKAREVGNKQMSSLLNYCDGVLHVGNKVIISTNLPTLRDVDTALIRPGRAYQVLEFRELSADEAAIVRNDLEMEPTQSEDHKSMTLAEITNLDGARTLPKKPRVGF